MIDKTIRFSAGLRLAMLSGALFWPRDAGRTLRTIPRQRKARAAPQSYTAGTGAATVDGERIINADNEPGNWMTTGRTYGETRFSPLTQITDQNVGQLGIAWYSDLDTKRGQEVDADRRRRRDV